MYSLLNYIAATNKDIYDVNSAHIHPSSPYIRNNTHSLESGCGLSEDEKRTIGISTISVVTKLALEFKVEEASFMVVRERIITNLWQI